MRSLKKSIAVFMAVMLTATSFQMMDVSAKAKKGKVTKITATKTVSMKVGEKKTVKVSVKTKGKASKKFKVTPSVKGVVKVTVKSGKIILTGVKAGTTKLTLKSKANKKKKTVVTVKVNPAATVQDTTVEIRQLDFKRFSLKFSKAVQLELENITVETKSYSSGKYLNVEKVKSLSTIDAQNYVVEVDDSLFAGEFVKMTIKGVNKTNIVKEFESLPPMMSGVHEICYKESVNEDVDRSIAFSNFTESTYGKVVSFTNLPTGIKYTKTSRDVTLSGTFKKAGIYKSQLVIEGEKGIQQTINLVFVVGSESEIYAYFPKSVHYVYSSEYSSMNYEGEVYGYISGGSGSYYIDVMDNATIFDLNYEDTYGCWHYTTESKNATYTGKLNIVDANNSGIKTIGNAVVETKLAKKVTGKVTSATGKPIPDAYVAVKALKYIEGFYSTTVTTEENGKFTLYVPVGTFDFEAYMNNRNAFHLNQVISGDTTMNFKLPLYQVQLNSSDPAISALSGVEWMEGGVTCGKGLTIFLPKGTYEIKSNATVSEGSICYGSCKVTVSGDTTATVTITKKVLPKLTVGTHSMELNEDYDYYLFVPEKQGNYSFTSSNSMGDPKGVLYSINDMEEVLVSGDDDNDCDFEFTAFLRKGAYYILGLKDYDGDGMDADITIEYLGLK
ncbi:MAG: carboxypeptidase-like regulatory domain-containing protein [Eubacterium sp.]|nr:carboxypeptidase-like regulatory domain-containing protein [Eubacterium sp.]